MVASRFVARQSDPRAALTGDGMIHGVRLEGGRAAWYRNRWVRTDSFKEDFPLYNADSTRNLRASVANTHVVNHAGKTLALVESSLPYEITDDLRRWAPMTSAASWSTR